MVIIIACAMITGLMAGCGSNRDETGATDTKEVTTATTDTPKDSDAANEGWRLLLKEEAVDPLYHVKCELIVRGSVATGEDKRTK